MIHIFCALRGIDLVARVRSGIFFSASELDDLEREAGKPIRMLAGRAAGKCGQPTLLATGRRRQQSPSA